MAHWTHLLLAMRSTTCSFLVVVLMLLANGTSEIITAKIELGYTLSPQSPYKLKVPIGRAQLVQFYCWGGPADAVITLETFAEHSDPLIFLSMARGNEPRIPSISDHDMSSFDQWQEDAAGNHHLVVKNLGVHGGILGLLNTQHFAKEDFEGILSIRCDYILAFDTLFWDFLHSEAVCPVGDYPEVTLREMTLTLTLPEPNFKCSGHGTCAKGSVCRCESGWVGAACQHRMHDMLAVSQNHYDVDVGKGRYRYFRIRVPPTFRGGFLDVNVSADAPVVVLIAAGEDRGLPTKRNFDLSNFDAWLDKRNFSRLQYRIEPAAGASYDDRRLAAVARRLPGTPSAFTCPRISGGWQEQEACHTKSADACRGACDLCMVCNKTTAVDDACASACNRCMGHMCVDTLAECAAAAGCMEEDARQCEHRCTSCIACMDSNDAACQKCRCCSSCFPLAAKCGTLASAFDEINYVYVAVHHHRRSANSVEHVKVSVDISLREEPSFVQPMLPSSWIGELYDRFQNVQDLEMTQRTRYPDEAQFLYNIDLSTSKEVKKRVSLFEDRLTLLHVGNPTSSIGIKIAFSAGPKIVHVLSSTAAAPKTLFDFDRVHMQQDYGVLIDAFGKPDLWCAIFAKVDASLIVTISPVVPASATSPTMVIALVSFLILICGLLLCGSSYSAYKKKSEHGEETRSRPLSERIAGFLSNRGSSAPSDRNNIHSLQGYMSSSDNVMDPMVEEQYLFRGGFGDDGM